MTDLVLLAIFNNLVFTARLALFGGLGLFVVALAVGGMMAQEGADEDALKPVRLWRKRFLVVAMIGLLPASLPNAQELWEMRVALLKLELASPQNVQAAGDHLDTIVKGLECKYLGENCPNPEKDSK